VDKNYSFFEDNLQELIDKYGNKFVAIKDQKVIGVHDSFDDAYVETIKGEDLGSFIIQHCSSDALMPSANFAWNNVAFSPV